MRKILFFQWRSFMNKGIERALQELNWEYDTFFYQFQDWEKDDKFQEMFRDRVKGRGYTDVLSVNFSPLISEVCEELEIPYTAWVYDAPVHIRNLDSMKNSCNRIFFFDRGQALIHQKEGIHAYHLPLAVDTDVFHLYVSEEEKNKYKADISLLGKLYQTEYTYFTSPLDEYTRGYLEGIVNSQMKIYGGYLIPELITDDLLNRMNRDYAKAAKDGFQMGRRELEYMLACETTGRERYTTLALLSAHFLVDLYSSDKDDRLKNVRFHGYADYYSQMPLVFSQSRINLNMSLKAIRTGIPLRVIDIMGCGGFVLTNYQEEIAEHFVQGVDCVIYEDTEDLFMKVKYYLEHEEERKKIALHGFEKVKRDFTFKERLMKMFCEK